MGWASGSYMAEEIYDKIRPYIKDGSEYKVAKFIYDKFCEGDADDWSFCDLTRDVEIVGTCIRCEQDMWNKNSVDGVCEICLNACVELL